MSPMNESGKPALSITGLKRDFGAIKVLQGIDFSLAQGETVGILGPNGAGKTTLMNCLSGILPLTAGEIRRDGEDITRHSAVRRARGGMVRTFQNLRLFGALSAEENVALGLARNRAIHASEHGDRVARALAEHGLGDIARRRTSELPYGVQRRVEIARALVGEPRILLLDEPGAGLGSEECALLEHALVRARESFGCSIVLIDHNVPFVASVSDRLLLLAQGRIMRDAPSAELLADPIVGELYLGKGAVHAQA